MAKFCPHCGVSVSSRRSAWVAQLICGGIIGVELLALWTMVGFVIPRFHDALPAAPSRYLQIVFNPRLTLAAMGTVAVFGGTATFVVRNLALRAALVAAALLIGVVPMMGTLSGIYVLTIEQADSAGQ
jgi:hypothetical protein